MLPHSLDIGNVIKQPSKKIWDHDILRGGIYRVFILQAYWTFRTSYRQTLISPGKLEVIHSVITYQWVSQCYAIERDKSIYCAVSL
jgi:hypothetical protein